MINPRLPTDDENPDDWDGGDWADATGARLGDMLDRARGEREDDFYSEDWGALSKRVRAEMDWCCEQCGINLSARRDLLHVHHIDHNKQNNDRSNLAVVCAYCHSRFPDHVHILDRVGSADRELFLAHQKRVGRG